MRKVLLLIFVFSLNITLAAGTYEAPTEGYDIKDDMETDQKSRDKKIWQNLLQVYLGFRQIAENSLKICESVVDWAWSAHKYMAAVENLAGHAQVLWKNIKETGSFKWYDVVGIIEHLEEGIFQISDYMLEYDVKNIKESRKRLAQSRVKLFTDPFGAKNDMRAGIKNFKGYQRKHLELTTNCGMRRGIAEEYGYQAAVRRHILSSNTGADAVASGELRSLSLGNQAVIMENCLEKLSGNDGEISMTAMAEGNAVINRNRLFMGITENEYIRDGVRVTAMMLLQKASCVDLFVLNKGALVYSMEKLSDELKNNYTNDKNKWKPKMNKVTEKKGIKWF